jgi:GNAT superfamily N-acetyltransferase
MTRRNPDDEALLRRLTVEVDDDPASTRGRVDRYIEVRVFDGKAYVAIATFRLKRKYADAMDVSVNANYRRKGVASWLYRWVENRYGLKVLHSSDQTTDGKAFARGRRNPDDAGLITKLRFRHREVERTEGGVLFTVHEVEAVLGGRMIGFLHLEDEVDEGDGLWVPRDVVVDRAFRRRGVASWLYREAARRLHLKIVPSDAQTDGGKGVWRKGWSRKNPDDLVASASRSFVRFLNRPEMREMAQDFSSSTSWTQGLCMPLAFGVKKWLGGNARVLGLTTPDGRLQHAVVERDGFIIDGDGIQTPEALLQRWKKRLAAWPGGGWPLKLGPILAHRRRFSEDFGMTRSNRRDRGFGARAFADAITFSLAMYFPSGKGRKWLAPKDD